jgi:hypothetical protein
VGGEVELILQGLLGCVLSVEVCRYLVLNCVVWMIVVWSIILRDVRPDIYPQFIS